MTNSFEFSAGETAGRGKEEQGKTVRKKVDTTSAPSVDNDDEMYLFSTMGPGTHHNRGPRKEVDQEL